MVGRRLESVVTLGNALRVAAGVAVVLLACSLAGSANAQQKQGLPSKAKVPEGSKLLLSADNLTYDDKRHVVVASGAVRIAYGGYRLVAKRVEYDQDTGRMKASGDVQLINPDGTKLYGNNLDVTDDFADGFINAVRIDTTQRTHIVAESAERRGGIETQFNNGVYTACEPCKKHPEKAPFWQIKARRVVDDSAKQSIQMHDARFEMFGVPIAYFPYLSVPEPSAHRKSGFLRPGISYSDHFGAGFSVPYYQVISPYMDVIVTGTGYTKQGFMAEAQFRQQFRDGFHNLTIAGIDQASPDSFAAGTADRDAKARGMVGSQGQFNINPRWTVGWNIFLESDPDFARTYGITGYGGSTVTSDAHLTGIAGRNFFDLHAYHFDEQPGVNDSKSYFNTLEKQQPFVLPVIDYNYTPDRPIFGGQLTFTANETSLTRNTLQTTNNNNVYRYSGLAGSDNRLTGDLEWKRTLSTSNGLLLTPMLGVRGDVINANYDEVTGADSHSNSNYSSFAGNGTYVRTMETAGLEARYPILATTAHSTHVITPIAQIFVRPNEPMAGELPNEDAQSFVFDTTNLFSADKFSGFDRVEGGTRANVGLQYTGSFDNGVTLQSVFGQSYQLAGENSFAAPDLVYAGHDSGLENSVSDYVGSMGVSLPVGLSFDTQARFDKSSFDLKRTAVGATYASPKFSTGVTYAQLAPQPEYGSTSTQREVTTTASLSFTQNWRAFGNVTYNIEQEFVSREGVGLAFNNDCFDLSLVYTSSKDTLAGTRDWSIGATISFRTLGQFNIGSKSTQGSTTF